MGISTNIQTTKNTTFPDALDKILEIVFQRMAKFWLHSDFIFSFTKRAKHISKKMNNKDAKQITGPERKAFLDLLIELSNEGTKLTTEELHNEVNTIMAAANDTTATIISFVIFMLANFPKVQEKCYEELVEIFGNEMKTGRQVKNADMNRMEYLERVIKEIVRLFSAAPISVRKATDDLDIGKSTTIPKGTNVFLVLLQLHRSPDLWEDPLRFDPDQFLLEEVAKRHPCVFLPFSYGPCNCIGLKYTMMSLKILLATLLRHYIFVKDKHIEIKDIGLSDHIIIRPAEPITVRIKRRP